jgi:WD40 repeat protein
MFAVSFSPDGRKMAGSGASGVGFLWDINSWMQSESIPQGGSLGQIAFSPDSEYVVFTAGQNGNALLTPVWNLRTSLRLDNGGKDLFATAFAATPKSLRLLTGNLDGVAAEWLIDGSDDELENATSTKQLVEIGAGRLPNLELNERECGMLMEINVPFFRELEKGDFKLNAACPYPFLGVDRRPIGF